MNYLMDNTINIKKNYIPLLILYFFALCSQLYSDIVTTTYDGIRLLDVGLYWFSQPSGYPFPIYLFFAIWNFPIWLLSKFTSFTFTTYFTPFPWLWAKSICILFLFIDSSIIYRLCNEIKLSKLKSEWASIIFLTSMTTLVPAIVIAQYECIPICFILNGILSYIKRDNKKFFIFFSIAIVLKFFALIIFIPLILIKEKNIIQIIWSFIKGCSIYIFATIFSLLMSHFFSFATNSPYNSVAGSNSLAITIFSYFTEKKIGGISLFILFYTLSCIYIWLHDFSEYNFGNLTIYICAFIYIGMFICGNLGFYYWLILTVPFISILIVMSQNPSLLLFLTTIAQLCALLYEVIGIPWFFTPDNISKLGLLPLIFVNQTPVKDMAHIAKMLKVDTFFGYGSSMYAAIMIYFLYLTRPKKSERQDFIEIQFPRYIWFFRFVIGFGFVLSIYILYFV